MSQQYIFIISLPRSGSTLLQRILAADPSIYSTDESWVLLQSYYPVSGRFVHAEYSHSVHQEALGHFIKGLPQGLSDYDRAVRDFLDHLYTSRVSHEFRYILEKTPRYHLILPHLMRAFPDARFIFLWRNPLAVCASIVSTWGQNSWVLDDYRIDLYRGLQTMLSQASNYQEHVLEVRYEDLVTNQEQTMKYIYDFLNLSFDPSVMQRFKNINFRKMGDGTGSRAYDEITDKSLGKWKAQVTNRLRYRWLKNYLNWIGAAQLSRMGYNYDNLLIELKSRRSWGISRLVPDVAAMIRSAVKSKIKKRMYR